MIRSSDYNHKLYEIVREGRSGDWELEKIVLPAGRILRTYNRKGFISFDVIQEEWKSVGLISGDGYAMTDSPFEQETYKAAVERAKGRVLMCGLGLGLFMSLATEKIQSGQISGLDIVEINRHVIDLTLPVVEEFWARCIQGDAWTYLETTEEKYDFIFVDIWGPPAQALAEGPGIISLAGRCLNPGGETWYWLQEIGGCLSHERGLKEHSELPCRVCGKNGDLSLHYNLYGGLCLECAEEYESYKETRGKEWKSTEELGSQLLTLGCKNITNILSAGGRPDVIVKGSDGKILVDAKSDLLEELSDFVNMHCRNWVKVSFRGKPL